MTDKLLTALVIEPEGVHRSTLIWLHGLGADGYDFKPVASELMLPASLGVRFVLPHAPRRPVTVNGGYVMPAWYDVAAQDISYVPDESGIRASRQAVAALIEREIAAGIAPERVIVAGFSQGGVIALETGLAHPERVGGVIALSCYVALPLAIPPAAQPLPIFMAHGTADTVVPHVLGSVGRDLLEARGHAVEWHSYAMPHSVCWEELQDIRAWLLARLGDS
ncbi:alpha/beta hydrolase [Methylomagnum sp.]